jgi:hypothetical protein
MKSAIVKHSVHVDRRWTRVSLEPDFWNAVREIADSQGETVPRLITRIMQKGNMRTSRPLFACSSLNSIESSPADRGSVDPSAPVPRALTRARPCDEAGLL